MKTRYRKVIRDLTHDYAKNFMLVLAIAIGVCGIGSIMGGYSVIKREMTDNYMGTVPASATIELEDSISASMAGSIKKLPGIKEAERHATVTARMKIDDRWYPLLLFIADDFAAKQTNKIRYISGAAVPAEGTMLAERTAFTVMNAKEGDTIIIKTPHGEPKKIKLTGTVHDPGLAPAWQEQTGFGYITLSTLHWLGETQNFDQLRILVTEKQDSKQYITEKAAAVADWLKTQGRTVREIQVPSPGKHPHQSQMNTVMMIFIVFAFMILVLGSILVSASMSTLMVKQTRQIGMMKAIGAGSSQVIGLYLFMMMIICAVAIIIGIPLSRLAATAFYNQIAILLNLEIRNNAIPFYVPLLQTGSGIIIPFIAAAIPVIRGSCISVRLALDNYGVSQKKPVTNPWLLKLSRITFNNETFLLSIRNVFRLRTRLAMTLGLLAAGGAMFMTALNVSEAWEKSLGKIYIQRLYDIDIRLHYTVQGDTLVNRIKNIPGVRFAEGWNYSTASFAKNNPYEITNTYPDKGHGSFTIQAMPVPTRLLNPTVTEGQWLTETSSNDVVLNQSARALSPDVKTGDHIYLLINGQTTAWKVTGFTKDYGSPAIAYVSLEAFTKQLKIPGEIKMLRIAYTDRSKENVIQKNREVEKLLESEKIPVSVGIPVWLLRNAIAGHMKVLVNALLSMAVLMGIVGILGLMSTMSISVMERTREIGIMRAMGATPGKIGKLVTWEGFIIGIISIFIAFLLSLLPSFYIGQFIGNMSFRTPLSLTFSITAAIIWIFIIVVGSYIASAFPARRANKITTREALAYE
ncbi:MAG: ABC transporter permease [Chitinophagaceae bacterium]|nr:ABC transporter permease [Chitinophagaceae bacterium]